MVPVSLSSSSLSSISCIVAAAAATAATAIVVVIVTAAAAAAAIVKSLLPYSNLCVYRRTLFRLSKLVVGASLQCRGVVSLSPGRDVRDVSRGMEGWMPK